MSCRIRTTAHFDRDLKRLGKRYRSIREDFLQLLQELGDNPTAGVALGDGLRKVRMSIASKGKGKSGGARVITYNMVTCMEGDDLLLLMIYDKSERTSVSKRELVAIMKESGYLR